MKIYLLTIGILIFVYSSFGQKPLRSGLPISLAKGMEIVDSSRGAWLIRQQIKDKIDTSVMYIQIIDLRYNTIGQYFRLTSNEGKGSGLYAPGQKHSPYFERLPYDGVIDTLSHRNGKGVWSVVNASFFEKYEDSTQLSFPVIANGRFITAGSSIYGPSINAANTYYQSVQLKAMAFTKNGCYINNYSPKNSSFFKTNNMENVLVTYDYKDHPVNYFTPAAKNRFQLAAILQAKFKSNFLVLLSSTNTTINTAATYLINLGVRSSILALDGGASVFLYNQKEGTILKPDAKKDASELKVERLPHYLFIQPKPRR